MGVHVWFYICSVCEIALSTLEDDPKPLHCENCDADMTFHLYHLVEKVKQEDE